MPKKRIDFRVNGEPLRPSMKHTFIRFLDNLPFGELVTTQELFTKTGSMADGNIARHPELLARHAKHNNLRVWGNPKTIQELNRQLAR